jgi:flagellar motor switch protein FliN/FliY
MKTGPAADAVHRSFSSSFFDALVKALTEASGSPWLIAAMPDVELPPDGSEPVRVKLALEGAILGGFQLEFQRTEAIVLAQKLLRQPSDEFGTEQSEALLNLVKAGINEFSSALVPEYGTFTINASSASMPASDVSNVRRITASDDNANRVSILMFLDPALSEALTLHAQAERTDASAGSPMKDAAGNATPAPVNLSLVMDVELNVTLRFGQRQLTLREVLELTSGSVVELDRQVEEPVELLLEGKVIAKGEAVVIDGNYGLRVTEVSQPILSPAFRGSSQSKMQSAE